MIFRPVSPFIAAHAWHEFRDGLIWKGILLLLGTVSLGFTLVRLSFHYQTDWREFTWSEIAVRVLLGLTVLLVLSLWNLLQAFNQARRAWVGEWPRRHRFGSVPG